MNHIIIRVYPELPHRDACWSQWMRVRAPVDATSLAISRLRLHHAILGAQGVLLMRVEGVTSKLDIPSLMPLSVAGCSQLQLGVPHWATSVITASS